MFPRLLLLAALSACIVHSVVAQSPQDRAPLTALVPDLAPAAGGVPTAYARGGDAAVDLTWTWTNDPRWLDGVDFGGDALNGGVFYGRNWFMGSTIAAEADIPIEIRFSTGETTLARVFRRDLGYADGGVGTFQGSAWDVSDPANPRRLNVCFVEDAGQGSVNALWDPSNDTLGKREYLLIMASDYDGDGSTYAGANPVSGPDLDLHYGAALRVVDGLSLYQTDPATLALDVPPLRFIEPLPGNGEVTINGVYRFSDGDAQPGAVRIYGDPTGTPTTLLDEIAATAVADMFSSLIDGLDLDATYTFRVDLVDAGGGLLYSTSTFTVQPRISENVDLAGTLDPRPPSSRTYGDIWGYTDSDGTEYALLAARDFGLSIIDISGTAPVEVGFAPGNAFGDSKDVKVYGDYAYLVNENAPLQIIDLSNPTSPTEVGQLSIDPEDGGAHNVEVAGDYLYTSGGSSQGNFVGGVRIYSLANPVAPSFIGEFQDFYYHDTLVRGDTLYGAGIYGDGVDILDLSDRANPTRIATFNYPGSGAHNICSTEDGSHLFVGDEIGSSGNWTRVFDVRDPQNAELVAEIIIDSEAAVHNCYVKGTTLYLAHYTEGFRAFDVTDPANPVEIGFYDTFLQPGYGYRGAWSVYPYFASDKIILSDMQSGLFVFNLDDATVAIEPSPTGIPMAFTLGAAYPNPFTEATTLPFTLDAPADIRLVLFDAVGREVAIVAEGAYEAGTHTPSVDGSGLPSGVYLARLTAGGRSTTQRLTLLK